MTGIRGRCMECHTLRPVTPIALALGSRQCDYAPVIHDVPDRHVACGSVVEYEVRVRRLGVDAEGTPTFAEDYEAVCALCGLLDDDAEIGRSHERCLGSRKPIR